MSVYKRTYRSGQVVWHYVFTLPGSTREKRLRITGSGFATKSEAQNAEAVRRIEEQQKWDMAKAGANVVAQVPRTLGMLLEEFFAQHVDGTLAPKTIERYHDQAAYLDPELRAMPIAEITPLHLNREWNRLLKSGGHHRNTKQARPLSAKTVRNVAGIVSSAFTRAIRWGLVLANPVTNSEPPRPKRHLAIALTPTQQATVLESASGPWCMRTYLQIAAASGCRRGELLALRWSDLADGGVIIARSLTQTRDLLEFKGTKTEKPRPVALPASALIALDAHRRQQDEFRRQFGPDSNETEDVLVLKDRHNLAGPVRHDHVEVGLFGDSAKDLGRVWIQGVHDLFVEGGRAPADDRRYPPD